MRPSGSRADGHAQPGSALIRVKAQAARLCRERPRLRNADHEQSGQSDTSRPAYISEDISDNRFSGALRDTLIVPEHVPVTIAFDANLKGAWFLHCHHLYHMATGMMTEVRVV